MNTDGDLRILNIGNDGIRVFFKGCYFDDITIGKLDATDIIL